jgi:hypothetical protein
MLSVANKLIMLSVIMLSVVAPQNQYFAPYSDGLCCALWAVGVLNFFTTVIY